MNNRKAILFAILAAVLYAISTPFSKILMEQISPVFMAGLMYLGAGIGMTLVTLFSGKNHSQNKQLTHSDLPYLTAMVGLDIAAPILLMVAIKNSSSESVSLLNNFEVVSTSVIALLFFKETISLRLWLAIGFITIASLMLSFRDNSALLFSPYSLCALLACVCWGVENNCTRKLSHNNPAKIVIIKGFGSGTGSVLVALIIGDRLVFTSYILFALLLGFVAYGLSIYSYVYAQRYIGAAKTSAFYALSPFIGAVISIALYPKKPSLIFIAAFITMAAGTYFTLHESEETHMDKRDFKFDKRADKYDDHFEGKLSRKFYELLYRYTDLSEGSKVLDVGCGTGTILKTFSEFEKIEGHGIDVEPNMLKVARQKCPDMDIRECSCENTPYKDDYFDSLTACMAYHHFPDKNAFEKEALRILKPGGKIYIADPSFPLPIRKLLNFLCRNINGEFFSSAEMKERFEKQGFKYIGTQKDHYAQLVILQKAV